MTRTPRSRLGRIGRAPRALAIVATAAMTLSLTAVATAAPAPTANPQDFSATAAAQVAALQKIKTSLSPAERKLDSALVLATRQQANKAATAAVPRLQIGVTVSATGTTSVAVTAAAVTPALLSRLRAAGAVVTSRTSTELLVTAPLRAVPTIASWSDVQRVARPVGALTARMTPKPVTAPETKQQRAARLGAQLGRALEKVAAPSGQGSVVSEGDKAEGAAKARARYKVTGTGVKVCALSDGVDSLAAAQATGDLPAVVDVLPDQEGLGDEGTAMLEIIHDLAPNAELGFATAFTSGPSFAQNIRDLRSVARCDIIVDDVLYYNESPFQDGPIARSVNVVTADGALYFSSAGNEGNTIDGTSGNYAGDFVDSGRTVGKFAGAAHDFDPGPGVQVFDPLSDESAGTVVPLFWAEPLGGATPDYDLYEFDATGNVVALSQDVQNGTQDPFEILQTAFVSGGRLAVVKFSGAGRYLQVTAFGGRFSDSTDGLKAYVSPGVTRGHSAAVNAFSVGAAPAADPLPFSLEPGDPPNPAGPYPGLFTRAQKPERFTSDGPRRVFFTANGTPITPGNTSSTGGAVRSKPDIIAADGVSTTLGGFDPFFGTSAAAPHAAAIAALVLSGNPGASARLVRSAFNATALDLAPVGTDTRSGRGLIRADRVLANTGATPQPLVRAGTATVTPTTGDGDAFLEPGETGTLTVPAVNTGDSTAQGVSVRVRSTDPRVTITPGSRGYGAIAAGATVSRDFTIKVAKAYPVGKPLALEVTVTFAGALSPTNRSDLLSIGQPAAAPTDFAYDGPVVPIPDSDPAGVSVTLPVTGLAYAARITFSVDGTACTADAGATTVGIDHTWVADLIGTLTNPSGVSARLFSRNGGSGNNLCQVVFDDAATAPFSSVSSDDAPCTGSWKPADPLASLVTTPVDGDWVFTVSDNASGDTGNLRAVSLHLTGYQP